MPIDKTKVKHFKSFKEAEEYEIEEMNKLSYQERLSILLSIINSIKDETSNKSSESGKRHRRF